MKKRWKGLCALWMVLALVVGASPVTIAAENDIESIAFEADSGLEQSEEQTKEEESFSKEESETSEEEESETEAPEAEETETETSETEETKTSSEEVSEGTSESPAEEDDNEETLEKNAESEETTGETVEEETESSLEETILEESDKGNGELSDESLEVVDAAGIMLLDEEVPVDGESTTVGAYLYKGGDTITPGNSVSITDDWEYANVQFDVSFESQDSLHSITAPEGKELKGWSVWKGYGSGSVIELADNNANEINLDGQIAYSEYQSFIEDAGEKAPVFVIVPQWADIMVTIKNGVPIYLKKNVKYTLPPGEWQVEGDSTIYKGGQDFYIALDDGEFTFTQIQKE